MTIFKNSFKDFSSILIHFKTKKIYLIFFLYILFTLLEMLNIAAIIPLVSILLEGENKLNNLFLFKYLEFQNFQNNKETIKFLIVLTFFIFFIKALVQTIALKLQADFYALIRSKIANFFYNIYLYKSFIYYQNKKQSSDIIRNLAYLNSAYTAFLERTLLLFNDFFVFLGVIIFFGFYNFKLFFSVLLIMLIISFLFVSVSKKYFYNLGKSLVDLSSSIIKQIQETLNNILQIKLLKKEEFFKYKFYKMVEENSYKLAKVNFFQSLPKILIEFVAILVLLTIISVFVYKDFSTTEITALMTLFLIMLIRLIPFLGKLITYINSASSFAPSLNILNKEIKDHSKNINVDKNINSVQLPNLDKIDFEEVEFIYPETDFKILSKINLNLKKNNIYGIIGPSGSGKTTFLNILTGLIRPTKGIVKYNNLDIVKGYTAKIGYVSQSSSVLNSSIKNNIAFGCDDKYIDEDKLVNSLKDAQIYDEISSLDKSYNTIISELGGNFSGGQIQRISIARLLYNESNLLIFDEPTSSLDEENSKNILNTILKLRDKGIVFIVSHKHEDMYICDKVYKIEGKKLILE